MTLVMKLTHQQSVDVCYICVEYLSNKCLLEKGLFRNPPSVVEIRKLRAHMMNDRQARFIKDQALDPHLVAGVLQLTLKDMDVSVMNKVYADMMTCGNDGADFSRSKAEVVKWMCTFEANSFNFIRTLLAFLHQLGTTSGNDANISQLVFIFAPLLCRPKNSAYMSVRHMEDLRKLRPTLQVIVENYVEIFSESQPCGDNTANTNTSNELNPRSLHSDMESYPTDPREGSHAEEMKNSDPKSFSPTQESPIRSELTGFEKKKMSLNLNVAVTSPQTEGSENPANTVVPRVVNYQSAEWNKLEQMVFALSESFLKKPFEFFRPTSREQGLISDPNNGDSGMVMSNENDLMACTIETFEGGAIGFGPGETDSPSRESMTDEGRFWTQSGSVGPGDLFSRSHRAALSTSSDGSGMIRASNRRRMVHECRSLRQQITKFEKEWSMVHNRSPKGSDKGHMQPVYSKYRDMKREIRASAAMDIQRLLRGFLARAKVRGKGFHPTSPSRYARSSPRPSTSPARKSESILTEMMSPPRNGGSTSFTRESDSLPSSSIAWKRNNSDDESGDMVTNSSEISSDGRALHSKYKDLLLQKRTLKRRLKRFDEEFILKHNRQPRKTDKEIMRPHYQTYHEVRNEMQLLKARIEREHGSLPAELQEAGESDNHSSSSHGGRFSSASSLDEVRSSRASGTGMEHSSSTPALTTGSASQNNSGREEEEEDPMTRFEYQQGNAEGGRRGHGSSTDSSGGNSSGWLSASRGGTEPDRSHAPVDSTSQERSSAMEGEGWSRASSNTPVDAEALQKEKRQLHIVLKAYERDFNQIHGRHVMKPEDIAPVAGEYQRYKELKKRLKDLG